MLNLNLRDFNILGFKVSTTNSKKDISLVSGYNSYAQKIEQILKTQKGELPSDLSIGSNYYSFIFDPLSYKNILEIELAEYIKYAIPGFASVKTKITYYDSDKIIINVFCIIASTLKNQTINCTIEVPLQ